MIVDHDPGDECDHRGLIERTVALLRAWVARTLAEQFKPFNMRRDVYALIPRARQCVMFDAVLEASTDDHDPGDEDRSMTILASKIAWSSYGEGIEQQQRCIT